MLNFLYSFLFPFLFFFLSSYSCVLTANFIKKIRPCNRFRSNGIYDVIHDNFPPLQLPYLSDILSAAQLIVCVMTISFPEILLFLQIMTVSQLLRVVCMISTALPPLKKYEDKERFGGLNGTGTEYIFSGHASYSALASIFLYNYGAGLLFLVPYNLLTHFLVVATRNHYTVDVILSWIIVPLLYKNFV